MPVPVSVSVPDLRGGATEYEEPPFALLASTVDSLRRPTTNNAKDGTWRCLLERADFGMRVSGHPCGARVSRAECMGGPQVLKSSCPQALRIMYRMCRRRSPMRGLMIPVIVGALSCGGAQEPAPQPIEEPLEIETGSLYRAMSSVHLPSVSIIFCV